MNMQEEQRRVLRETFDRVHDHLMEQGRRSVKDAYPSLCVYRLNQPEGPPLRCAVGCLISDEAYDPEMEGQGVVHTSVGDDGRWHGHRLADALNKSGIPAFGEMKLMLIDLQKVHDLCPVDSWPIELQRARKRMEAAVAGDQP